MATTKIYLDDRSGVAPYPLKLTITHERKAVHLSMDVKIHPEQWDGSKVIKHPRAQTINAQLVGRKADIDCLLYDWQRSGALRGKTAKDIRDMIVAEEQGKKGMVLFGEFYRKVMERKSQGTRAVYEATLKKIAQYADLDALALEDITHGWLCDFDVWLAKSMPSVNSRGMYYRNIRAVVNDAIDEGIISSYPFRRFKIKKVETRKRSLSLSELHALLLFPVEETQRQYVDMFRLMLLLRGINLVDLCNLKRSDMVDGRIEYHRAKTHKLYSIKIEPEIEELLDKYKGVDYLINIRDRYGDYKNYKSRINKELKRIGPVAVGKHGKKTVTPLCPDLSTYWARHTFATIARNECGLSLDVISDLLGHSNGMAVTNVYIRRDIEKIDEAARKVIDKIMYNK